MTILLKEVSIKKDLNKFIDFPHTLYRNNPYCIPSLRAVERRTFMPEHNPAYEFCKARCWLAYRNGKVAGRVAAIENLRHIEKWDQRYLRFGWLDFIDDEEVSSSLLGAVENWAIELGMSAVHGPLGFSNMDHAGFLIEGYEELGTMATIYNHPYYRTHLERLGYGKHVDWVEYELSLSSEPDPTIARIADLSLRRNKLHILKTRRKKEMVPYARELFHLYNEEYRNLYSAVPLSDAQIENAISQYLTLISPKYLSIILDEKDGMIGFGIVMPSLSKILQRSRGYLLPFLFLHLLDTVAKNERADLYLVAVKAEYQGKGVNAIMMDQIHRLFIKEGIKLIETNPELEWNTDVQGQWKYYQKRQHKRRRAFIKYLDRSS